MKKLIFILVVLLAISTTAQTTPTYKTIKLTAPPIGGSNDDILTIGADKVVKKVAKSSIAPVNTPKYKVYTAILSFDFYGAVTTINVLDNTLGFVPSIQKLDIGVQGLYSILSSEGFTLNKTFVYVSTTMGLMEWVSVNYQINDSSQINLITKKNNILQYMDYQVQVEIRVYN